MISYFSQANAMYWIIAIAAMLAGLIAQYMLRKRFKEYGQIPLHNGMSGKDVAEKMLRDNGIFDVKVLSVGGQLSDHYNPANKTVNLSAEVYEGRSVAAAAVAAHECGHAVQHATAYQWLNFRSKIVPVVQVSSSYMQWILLIGFFTLRYTPIPLFIGILLYGITTLFSIITLPVEFDASNRGLAWLDSSRITLGEEHDKAKSALRWAASTYVIAAISSLAMLLYYIGIFSRRR